MYLIAKHVTKDTAKKHEYEDQEEQDEEDQQHETYLFVRSQWAKKWDECNDYSSSNQQWGWGNV